MFKLNKKNCLQQSGSKSTAAPAKAKASTKKASTKKAK